MDNLYRGKQIGINKWAYGVPVRYCGGQYGIIKCDSATRIYPYEGEDHIYHCFEELYSPKVYPDTISRNTGISDKNGTDIFERDIVKTPDGIYPVVYRRCAFWLYDVLLEDNDHLDFLGGYDSQYIEVVGNLHDDLELLRENYEAME